MKLLKLADLLIQLIISTGCIVWGIIKNDLQILLYLYFILGGWQLLSFLAHYVTGANWANRVERKRYARTILWIAIVGAICYLLLLAEFPLIVFYLIAMLIVSPVLACWYFVIGLTECRTIRHRELIHLK
jgi:hypothetical protein